MLARGQGIGDETSDTGRGKVTLMVGLVCEHLIHETISKLLNHSFIVKMYIENSYGAGELV